MNRPLSPIRRIWLPATVIALTLLLCAGASCAAAASPIEGVWSFNGGAVDIVGQSNGTLVGVVSAPTKFAKCVHAVKENMWTGMRLQPDGSYWGFHQWYFEPTGEQPECVSNPKLGETAWRVLQNSQGESFLRVCFSEPGSNSQPIISANGSSTNVTYGCVDSGAIAPLPTVSKKEGKAAPKAGEISFKQAVALPSAKRCVRRNRLTIKVREPKYDPFTEVTIRVNGKRVLDIHNERKLKKAIVLKHLPSGSYTIRVLAITVLKQRLSGSLKYHSCSKNAGKLKLHRITTKPKHHKS